MIVLRCEPVSHEKQMQRKNSEKTREMKIRIRANDISENECYALLFAGVHCPFIILQNSLF